MAVYALKPKMYKHRKPVGCSHIKTDTRTLRVRPEFSSWVEILKLCEQGDSNYLGHVVFAKSRESIEVMKST